MPDVLWIGDAGRELDRALVGQLEPGSDSGDLPGVGLNRVFAAVLVGGRGHGGSGVGDRLGLGVVGGDVERPSIDDFERHKVQVDRVCVGGRVNQQPVFDSVGLGLVVTSGKCRLLVEVRRVLDVEVDRGVGERVERLRQVLHARD